MGGSVEGKERIETRAQEENVMMADAWEMKGCRNGKVSEKDT